MQSKHCSPKCRFDDSYIIAQRNSPQYPDDPTAKYSLVGCKRCGQLKESRRGPDADRWGTASSEEIDITYEYAFQNYLLNKDEIISKLRSYL